MSLNITGQSFFYLSINPLLLIQHRILIHLEFASCHRAHSNIESK